MTERRKKLKGRENAYKAIVTGAVGGVAGVIHAAESATTDCQPNDNVIKINPKEGISIHFTWSLSVLLYHIYS